LFKDSKSGRKGEVPSLFNQKKSNLQQFDSQGLPKSYRVANGFYQIFNPSTFVQWASCPPGTQPGQQNTRTLIFTFFCKGISKGFGLKIGKESSDWHPKHKNKKQCLNHKSKITKFFSGSLGSGSKLGLRIFGLSNGS
jgi:hypothetical protein